MAAYQGGEALVKLSVCFAALAVFAAAPVDRLLAVTPSPAPIASATAQSATIPFDPPLGEALRYRWEKAIEKDGKTAMAWSVSDYRFDEAGKGYRLTVTPVSSGSNETDPAKIAISKKLERLLNIPFVLQLDELGVIAKLENDTLYWSTIVRVLREELAKPRATPASTGEQEAIRAVMDLFEKMPADARLALLTEAVQPLVEFVGTETTVGEPIRATVETPSAWGGQLKREININLVAIAAGKAHLSVHSTIPRSELERLAKDLVQKVVVKQSPSDRIKMNEGFAALESFQHETSSAYKVWLSDGMLADFLSTETISTAAKSEKKVRITTRSLARAN